MLFLVLIIVENVFIGLKKGISKKMHWVAAKHTAYTVKYFSNHDNCISFNT